MATASAKMRKFLLTSLFCTLLLCSLSSFLFPTAGAAENPILQLLNLPAPPPPNPDVILPPAVIHDKKFYSKSNPPGDDAPIEILMEYWRTQSRAYNSLAYKVYPSDKVLGRLMDEFRKRPEEIVEFLNIFPKTSRSAEFVKKIYDDFGGSATAERRELRSAMRRWMKFNTTYFSSELAREAAQVADEGDYVSNHDALIALARLDWEKAGPIVSRLYNNSSQKASQTAALWALYVHALESGDSGDTERYRDELKKIIADRSLSEGVRDLALDALSLEKEWNGRDEWYLTLLEDETMLDLGRFTGLTTLISNSPEEKYTDRMIALLDSDNINVRSAAARNLLMRNEHDRSDVLKALLPWLEDPKWLKEVNQGSRVRLVQALAQQKIPESVPALIAALDEKATRPDTSHSNMNAAANLYLMATNAMAGAANAVGNAASVRVTNSSSANRAVARAMATNTSGRSEVYFPLRDHAITALAFQADGRAVPALRRLLNEATSRSAWPLRNLVGAIYSCGGYSIAEQVDALESTARTASAMMASNNLSTNASVYEEPMAVESVSDMLALHIVSQESISDDLARAVVNRIVYLEDKEPAVAEMLKGLAMKWKGTAVNSLLLNDLKRNKIETPSVVLLLAERKNIREKQMTEVSEIRTASATAYGLSACLLEDPNDFTTILDGTSSEAKTAMLACARLIRAPLPIARVAEFLKSHDKLLSLAAERYLESEDSPEARAAVLAAHPGEARILGSTTAFFPSNQKLEQMVPSLPFIFDLFGTVSEYYSRGPSDFSEAEHHQQAGEIETRLQRELTGNPDLLGAYNWRNNYIHLYKDKAVFSWHDDPARFRERTLTKDEFDNFKDLLIHHRAADLPPFLSCLYEECQVDQLLMLGRNGGRRVFVKARSLPPLFAELEQMFDVFRRAPATVKYWASKEVPGLEVLFADDQLEAMAVWKTGPDFRLLTADEVLKAEIEKEIETEMDSLEEADEATVTFAQSVENLRTKRQYDSFAWFSFADGALATRAEQPAEVPYIPAKDDLQPAPSREQWKARSAAVEVRVSDEGLYKIVSGKVTQVRKGYYGSAVISQTGRWVVVSKYDDETGVRLMRVNLQTGREFPVASDRGAEQAIAFVPSINRVLIGRYEDEYEGHYDVGATEEDQSDKADGGGYRLLDPETGVVIPARGEVRPLVEQTFRSLQPASGPFEYWAAIPAKDGTAIGIYNSRTFTLKPVLQIPKISFASMDMWVDAADGKAYFVYAGHLLAVPLKPVR